MKTASRIVFRLWRQKVYRPQRQVDPRRIPVRQRASGSRAPYYGISLDDPDLRRMLVTHIHCGEIMQPIPAPEGSAGGTVDTLGPRPNASDPSVTYRCACGFSCDGQPDQAAAGH